MFSYADIVNDNIKLDSKAIQQQKYTTHNSYYDMFNSKKVILTIHCDLPLPVIAKRNTDFRG